MKHFYFEFQAVYYWFTATFKTALGLHCLLILLFAGNGLMGQTIDWEQTHGGSAGDYAHSISPTGDGGYILAGFTLSDDGDITSGNQGANDVWVVKLNSNGTIAWEQTYGGSGADYVHSISPTGDGGYILAGFTSSNNGDITSGNQGSLDVWVVKLESNGSLAWEQTYGGSAGDEAYSISPTGDGGYILAGSTSSNDGDITSGNQGSADVWVVKLDSNGTIAWEQTYGGSAGDYAQSISLTGDGGYILAGRTFSNNGDITSGNQGSADVWVVKLDSDGTIAWEQTYGGSADDYAYSISPTDDGGYILVGRTRSNNGDITSGNQGSLDVWVVKLESNGSLAWEQTYGGSAGDEAYSISPTGDGGYILAGFTSSNNGDITSGNQGSLDVWVVKLDSDGSLAWEQTYGGSAQDYARSISPTGNGSYILAGYTTSNNGDITSGNQGFDDVWVIKLKLTIVPDANNILYVNQEVNQTATGYQPTGNSWENALPELRDALSWAATDWDATTDGTLQIWVAKGKYTPTADATDRDATFQLVNGVELYGGFAGNEPATYELTLRDFATNTSILSGDIDTDDATDIITAPNTQIQGDNSYTVVNGSGTDNTALLDGFTITAGYAQTCNTTVNTPGCSGAGVYNNQGSPTLSNTFISGNRAAIYGGGMYNTSNSSPSLINVEISNNAADQNGGGLYNQGSSPSLTNVSISGNTASNNGSEWYNASGTPVIRNSIIFGNGVEGQLSDTEYSLVQDQTDYSGTGNIDATDLTADDIFTDAANGDFSFHFKSPAINTGDNQLWIDAMGALSGAEVDLAGNPRVYDGEPDDDVIDMGAYEYQGEPFSFIPTNGVLYVDINVDEAGPNYTDGDGSSWANAIPDLANALKWAREQHDADNNWLANDSLQVWVATGTYKPFYNAADEQYDQNGNRDNAFVMVKNVQLYGGFDPDNGIDDLTDNRIVPSSTEGAGGGSILSGDLGTDGDNSDNAYHVLIAANDVGNALVDGFTLSGGNANGNNNNFFVNGENINKQQGGGIHKNSSSLSLTNMNISENRANFDGGGIYNRGTGTFFLTNVAIFGNRANLDGGGIANIGTISLTNVKVSGNTAINGGGISGLIDLVMVNVEISGNTSTQNGGGIYNFGTSELINVTLANNTAGNEGDGIYNDMGLVNITNSIVWNTLINSIVGSYTPRNSIIMGSSDTTDGNIDATSLTADDIFTDAASGNYSLIDTSPAINAGDSGLYTTAGGNLANDVDLAGNPRVDDFANNGVIDMGAYEYQGEENTPPVANCQDITVTLDANGEVSIIAEDIDNGSYDDEGPVILSIDRTDFDCDDLGEQTVTLTVEDQNGATTTCEATVTVEDNLAPTPDSPNLADITAQCEVLESDITPPTATDNCGVTVTVTNDATFPISTQGTTVITWTYEDPYGNADTQTQNVIIEDVTAPVPDVANLPDIEMECAVTAADIPIPTATDNCTGNINATTTALLSYTAQGSYTITWEYDDGNGNTGSQTQTIIVNDITAPVPDVANLPDIEKECEITAVDIPILTATDNCEGSINATTNDPLSYTDQGTYTITWNYDDGNGNTSSQTQNVVVLPSPLDQVTFDDTTVTYDGNVHTITVNNLPTGASVSYTTSPDIGVPNGATDAGTYTITAEIAPPATAVNCEAITLTAVLTIEKAPQEILFDPLPIKYLEDDDDFQLEAITTSGLQVSYIFDYNADTPPADVSASGLVMLLTSGLVEITAQQEGNDNYLPADEVIQVLQINSRDPDASMHNIQVEDQVYENPGPEIHYTADCDFTGNVVAVHIETEVNAQVIPGHTFEIAVPKPGIYTQEVQITSQDGSSTKTYLIRVEKRLSFEDIIVQKFNNVLMVNNNPETNGGYRFVAYQWYKNNQLIGTGQYYSAGDNSTDQLDPTAAYRVEMTTENGMVLQPCTFQVELSDMEYSVDISPNPVKNAAHIRVYADFPMAELQNGMQINIYSLTGKGLAQYRTIKKETFVPMHNMASGMYLIMCKTNKHQASFKIIVE
ncbi:T9SS type A sorting domain-containing protein [Galbibacter sp. EGI 63066]|uniref:choice-of-anchor Q domain-containing protein n=1 Tax=Galbibacter sp. EGI 63066 TaxID=2993559 RepID=UPI002248A573|nr:choice-of-anchor Q domain-containing protein [Galbibacter sp. EGI 63066]MCX2682066.1 T9SS type A sorting domain-containing protein [Galbibacter sp. EGI 63066]